MWTRHPDDVSAARDDRRHCLRIWRSARRAADDFYRKSRALVLCRARTPSPPPRPVPGCGLLCCAADCADVVDSFYESSSPRLAGRWAWLLFCLLALFRPVFPAAAEVAPITVVDLSGEADTAAGPPMSAWLSRHKGTWDVLKFGGPAYFFIQGSLHLCGQGRADGGLDPHLASAQARGQGAVAHHARRVSRKPCLHHIEVTMAPLRPARR